MTKTKQRFHRIVVTKEEALELFSGNPFKEQIIKSKVADGTRTTVYKCGELVDIFRGLHLPHTGRVKAFTATRHSATSWLVYREFVVLVAPIRICSRFGRRINKR